VAGAEDSNEDVAKTGATDRDHRARGR
jgi:hypothetical protein